MEPAWVDDELQSVDLRDKRLEKRMVSLLETLSKSSTASIPAACDDRAEMEAAYRFFDNEKVDFESVLSPHIDATYSRVARQKVALLVQDTTELDLTRPNSEMQGVGPLHNGRRSGALLHLTHAFTIDGTPLGTVCAEVWTREKPADESSSATTLAKRRRKRSASEKRVDCARRPLEDKESVRWLRTAEHCVDVQKELPNTQLVMLADRESDISDVIAFCSEQQTCDWIISGGAARVLAKKSPDEPSVPVRDELSSTKERFTKELNIRARQSWGSDTLKKQQRPGKADRDAREATVSVFAGEVTLNDPRPRHKDGLTLNAVLVRELEPPKSKRPIEWLLLTSLPVKTKKQIETVIAYYEQRWTIELLFKVLKSGCRIEERRFGHIDRFCPALALYLIIAWRSFYVCRISRTHENAGCELVFTKAEWQSVYTIVKQKRPPKTAPKLMEMTRLLATLGGYIDRKNTGPPGPQSIWLALQRMHDFATAWLTFGPGSRDYP